MLKRFNEQEFTWDGVDTLVYKQDNSPFKDVTRQVLFDGAWDIPCQLRYFEVKPGGYSTLEHHEHTHVVLIFRGAGQCLLGDEVMDVKVGDYIEIPKHVVHQFRANRGDHLGFLCLVNQERDKVKVVSPEDIDTMKEVPHLKTFFDS